MNETTPPPAVPPQPKTAPLAIWSLTLGVLGLAMPCLALLTVIPAVICGHIGLAKIRNSGGKLTGDGLAIAGLITGYAGILVAISMIGLLSAIAIPNFVKARQVSMQNACINNLREIQAAKNEWALENSKEPGAVPTEYDLTPYLRDGKFPVCPAGGSYTIGAVSNAPTCSIPGHKLPLPYNGR